MKSTFLLILRMSRSTTGCLPIDNVITCMRSTLYICVYVYTRTHTHTHNWYNMFYKHSYMEFIQAFRWRLNLIKGLIALYGHEAEWWRGVFLIGAHMLYNCIATHLCKCVSLFSRSPVCASFHTPDRSSVSLSFK